MNPDNINELTQIMNYIKIKDQKTAHDAVRNKQYIIGSYGPNTGMSFSIEPNVHFSAQEARNECRRLAKLHPGKTFIYVRMEGAEMTVPQPTAVSI